MCKWCDLIDDLTILGIFIGKVLIVVLAVYGAFMLYQTYYPHCICPSDWGYCNC
jgi:hypothetical protein